MCGRIFLLLVLALAAFVGVTVAAFVYLEWWQAILAVAAVLGVLFVGGKFLLKTAIAAWGEQLTKMTAGQSVVLRNATIQVHKVQRTDPPRELTEEDEFDDDDPDTQAERNEELHGKTWYKIEMTVFPNPDIEESVNPWMPESLVFVPFDREPPKNMLTEAMDDDVLIPDRMKRIGDQPEDEDGSKGPQRALFLVGVPNDIRDLAVRYFSEQFGRIRLPGPFEDAPRIRES
jgi:hypothetical protein